MSSKQLASCGKENKKDKQVLPNIYKTLTQTPLRGGAVPYICRQNKAQDRNFFRSWPWLPIGWRIIKLYANVRGK